MTLQEKIDEVKSILRAGKEKQETRRNKRKEQKSK